MSTLYSILFFFTFQAMAQSTAFNLNMAQERCAKSNADDSPLYMNEFDWGYTPLTMEQKFKSIYESGKRLPDHAVYNTKTQQFEMVHAISGGVSKTFKIDKNFILSVTRHIEVSMQKGFAEYVFFPDMGHSHLYFPESYWAANYNQLPESKNFNLLYQKMFADPELRVLYHTAEQLQMTDEDKNLLANGHLQFRYWHRNPMGYNKGNDAIDMPYLADLTKFNTVGELDGFHRWGQGFSISASKNGCFSYKAKDGSIYYFDIGLEDPPFDPAKGSF